MQLQIRYQPSSLGRPRRDPLDKIFLKKNKNHQRRDDGAYRSRKHNVPPGRILSYKGEYLHGCLLYTSSACNQKFHDIIYEVCPNRTTIDVTVRLKNQMRKYNSKTILIPGRDERSYQEHFAILEAVKEKDAGKAEQYMRQHIRNVRNTFDEFYSLLF